MDKIVKKCVFPAAGYGTRFLPATKSVPKEMLPIVDTPLIEYGVRESIDSGIDDIIIITGRGKRAIADHFDINYELEHQLQGTPKEALLKPIRELIEKGTFAYTRQKEMKGLGHAVLQAKNLVGNEPFGVILADDLCTNENGASVMSQLKNTYNQYGCSVIAVMEVPIEEVSKYGVISGSKLEDKIFKVDKMVEKPSSEDAPSNYAVIGRYILTPDIFEILEGTAPGKGGEIQLTDALAVQAKEGRLIALCFEGKRFDCGSIHGFVEATNYIFNQKYSNQE